MKYRDSRLPLFSLIATSLLLGACGSTPTRTTPNQPAPVESREPAPAAAPATAPGGGAYLPGDGLGADIPPDLDSIPDAVPHSEPLHRYANRPYVALGKTYTPMTVAGTFKERGIASWYGKKFHGQRTSCGEVYDMYGMTAAHPTLPIPSYARVTNTANGKSVVVRVNDRGPFLHDRVIDLSYAAAHRLDLIGNGSGEVEIESLLPTAVGNSSAKPALVAATPLPPAVLPRAEVEAPMPDSNIFLQLGAFGSREAAESFLGKMRSELGSAGNRLVLFVRDGLTRVHVGPYASKQEALNSASELQGTLGFKPIVSLH